MLKVMLTAGILLFCSGCQSVGECLFRPKYDYVVIFYSQNSYNLEHVGFRVGETFWSCGWLSANQMKVDHSLNISLTRDISCEWERNGQPHKKTFSLPQSVERKFQGTLVFFFSNDDVTMECEMYSDRVKGGPLADKYYQIRTQSSHRS